MTTQTVLASALPLPAGATVPEWVHLLPVGRIVGRDGRTFDAENLAAIMKASLASAPAKSLPIDYDHQIDLAAGKGGQAPAAGWVTELQARADGIWGRVEWTPRARTQIAAREYRFLSPAIVVPKPGVGPEPEGRILAVLRASLTNNPNFGQLTALNAAGQSMDPEKFIAMVRQAVGADAQASLDDVWAQLQAMMGDRSINSVDPARFVPIELFQKTLAELNSATTPGVSKELAERMVSAAEQQRKLLPFMRDWALELCSRDATAFQNFVDGAAGKGVAHFVDKLSEPADGPWKREERARGGEPFTEVHAAVGLTADDVAKYGN